MNQQKMCGFWRELRKEKGISQEELAEKLNVAGRTVSRWETGKNIRIALEIIKRMIIQ